MGESIVYDTTRHEAHCLNRVAACVWRHCDGRTSTAEMAGLLREELDQGADETTVRLILEHLEESHLLVERPRPMGAIRHTRRKAAKKLAVIGLSGLVMSIAVPHPAAAASLLPAGSPCSSSAQCRSSCCSLLAKVCSTSLIINCLE